MNEALDSLARLRPSLTSEGLPEGEPSWLTSMRDESFALAVEQGIPTRRLESWKSTNLAALEAMSFARIGPAADSATPAIEGQPDLVFIDGRIDLAASSTTALPAGLRVMSLADAARVEPELLRGRLTGLADPKTSALVALHSALFEDCAVVIVESGAQIERAIRMRFVSTDAQDELPSASFPRLLVIAEPNSALTLLQEHVSHGHTPGFTALVAELYVESGARVETLQVQAESAERIHYTSVHARVARDAHFDSHVFTLGNGLVRSELNVVLSEPGADTRMRGFYLGRDDAHVDHFTTVDHAADHCTSDQEYRGVLGDRSKGVFRGRVIVRPDAQKTDARQSNPNLLISKDASVDAKPQLEIYADDVRASHGSTIGQLDPDALFFLRARGIDEAEARLLLTRGFAKSIVDGIGDTALREIVAERVDRTLSSMEGA